jgi:ribonuclease HI
MCDSIYIYQSGDSESSFCFREPSGVFTSEISAILVALIQIRARRPGRYLIATDSMSSFKALQTRKVAPRFTRWYMKSRRPVSG